MDIAAFLHSSFVDHMDTTGVPLLTQEERRRRIIKLFEEGLTYPQIRNEMGHLPSISRFRGLPQYDRGEL